MQRAVGVGSTGQIDMVRKNLSVDFITNEIKEKGVFDVNYPETEKYIVGVQERFTNLVYIKFCLRHIFINSIEAIEQYEGFFKNTIVDFEKKLENKSLQECHRLFFEETIKDCTQALQEVKNAKAVFQKS